MGAFTLAQAGYLRGMGQEIPKAPSRPIITLTTDFGLDDWYVAAMKAVLLSGCRDAQLIDVTHRISPGDILCGSIALERAVDGFPPGTVHLAVVDPGVGSSRRMLVVTLNEQLIVCPDNGLITWAWKMHAGGKAWELTWRPERASATFHGRDIMGPAAAMLAAGQTIEPIARRIDDPVLLEASPAEPGCTSGQVMHIDRFGNAMSNIPADTLRDHARADVRVGRVCLGPVRRTYTDVAPGEALALIGSSGLLEVAVRDGSAAERLGLRIGQEVHLVDQAHSTADLRRLDKQHIWHPFTPMSLWLASDPLVITAAEGMHLIDSDGNRYLDGVSSLWCNVHGHGVPEIDDAVRRQLDRVAHSTMLGLGSEQAILLADRLMKIVPQNLKKVFYSDAGATATEIAFKMAVQYWHNKGQPQRTEFIGLTEAYHGDTFGAMSVGRTAFFHRPYFPMLFTVHYAPTPFVWRSDEAARDGDAAEQVKERSLREMERILQERPGRIAAIALEPVVQGAAGMIVQPPGYLAEVRRLADKYGVLLILDEVATGFGRTGRMFACEHEGVEPDLMCVAKGITGGYLPLAATFATQEIFDAFLADPMEGRTFFHGHTYTGNPLACAAAIASLDLMQRRSMVEAVARKAEYLAQLLQPLADLPHVAEIRQKGFMVGIELVADKGTGRRFDPRSRLGAQVCMQVRRHGVIIRPLGDVLVLMPPLAMEESELKTIVTAVAGEVAAIGP